MRRIRTLAAAAVVVLTTQALLAQPQPRIKPTAPGTPGDPVWQGVLRLPDGRTFVTDGGLVIDAALAKPAKLPEREFPPKLLEGYFSTPPQEEYGFGDLTAARSGKTYTTPNGMALNATYINFLRRTLPGTARLRLAGPTEPIVIVVDGRAVGAFMPVKQ